jgi:hypothetical protein
MIHRWLTRSDLAALVHEIARTNPAAAVDAARDLDDGAIDALLDSPAALDAVRGRGGAPAALPLTLLWYIPVRAALRAAGENDIDLADFTATIPITFVSSRATRLAGSKEPGLHVWTAVIGALPSGTVAQAERAAYCASLALWWAGCFPERIERTGGQGMLRAYGDFAAATLSQASRILSQLAPERSRLYAHAADRREALVGALDETRKDYLGRGAHSADERLRRFLDRIESDFDQGADAA